MNQISNIDNLRLHILELEGRKIEHELYFHNKVENIKTKMKAPLNFINKFKDSVFGKAVNIDHDESHKTDIVNIIARLLLPLSLNKLLFKKSNFLTKSLVSIFSQKVVSSLNKNTLSAVVDELTGFIKSKTKNNKEVNYGIPPDSETY